MLREMSYQATRRYRGKLNAYILNERSQSKKDICGMKVKVTQLYPTLCDHMGYTVHGIFQGGILEWVAFPFSRGSSQPRN